MSTELNNTRTAACELRVVHQLIQTELSADKHDVCTSANHEEKFNQSTSVHSSISLSRRWRY